jgi:hypothetical protein
MFAASGIVLNHRQLFSGVDVNRKLLPAGHHYRNWNNGAIRGSLKLSPDSVLVYGNIGIWLTDPDFEAFEDFNAGFRKGIDNRKVSSVRMLPSGELFAGTYFGLFKYDRGCNQWQKIDLPGKEKRVSDLSLRGDSLLVLTRSGLLIPDGAGVFHLHYLPPPAGYDDKVSLFKTVWVIHSGEIYGLAGKIIVDAVGMIFIFLTITGLVLFVNRYRIRGRKKKGLEVKKAARQNKWNLKWHNKIGWVTLLLLLLTTLTGMFLRPPLLLTIFNKEVNKIPGTRLAASNAWFDKLRAIRYDEQGGYYLVSTSDGLYKAAECLEGEPQRFKVQPPVSVMGINVFEDVGEGSWLVGSFSGLYVWQPEKNLMLYRTTMMPLKQTGRPGPPLGRNMTSGFSPDYRKGMVWFDYNRGAVMFDPKLTFPAMPERLAETPISLWNVSLEVHTGRIYRPVLGNFYILVVPLVGLLTILMSIAGFVVWFTRHRKRKRR